MRMEQLYLEQRLALLEASEAIRNLVGRYATAADQRNDPVLMQALFHPHAQWCANGFGSLQGRDQIVAGLAEIAQQQIVWSLHIMAQPDIQIALDAKTAEARWMLWELSTQAVANRPQAALKDFCLGGFYQCQLSPDQHGVWKFDRVELNLTLHHHYVTGFGRTLAD